VAAVQVQQVAPHGRVQPGEEPRRRNAPGSRERLRAPVQPVQAELRPELLERVERDPAVRRELPACDREHPGASDRAHGLARRTGGLVGAARQDAQPGERRAHLLGAHPLDGCLGLGDDLRDVSLGHGDRCGIAVVERVRRPQQQHALPGHCERHADGVPRDRQRRRPRPGEIDERVHALAEPDRRRRPRILEPAHGVHPRAARVHDGARAHGADPGDLRACDATALDAQRLDGGVVEDRRSRFGCTAHVREAEARVVRPRVRVDAAAA